MASWQVKVVEHGTRKLVAVPKHGAVTWQRRLDEISVATASWDPTSAPLVRKWRHELEIWSDRTLAWAGPIVVPTRATNRPVAVSARDLSARFERLFVARDRTYTQEDLGLIFGQLASDAVNAWPDLGIDVVTYPTGTFGDREYVYANFERLADKLRELARTDVDWTFVGRQLIAGGSSIPGRPTWTLLDAMVDTATATDDGLSQVNDAVVVGSKPTRVDADGNTVMSEGDTPTGRWTDGLSIASVGPLQVRYSEPDIRDDNSAGVAARNRVRFLGAQLPDLRVTLKEGTYRLDDLVPGAAVRAELSDPAIPYGQTGDYLLLSVDGTISDQGDAAVTVNLIQAGEPA